MSVLTAQLIKVLVSK